MKRAALFLFLPFLAGPAPADLVALYTFEDQPGADLPGAQKKGRHQGKTFNGKAEGGVTAVNDVNRATPSSKSIRIDNGHIDVLTAANGGNAVNPFDGSKDFSIAAWFKSTVKGGRVLLSSARDAAQHNHSMAWFVHQDFDGNLRIDYFFVDKIHTGNGLHDGKWHFGAVSYTAAGKQFTVYLDGSARLERGSINAAIPNIAQDSVRIGGTRNPRFPEPGPWTGFIDDLAIFDHALSPAEIDAIHKGDFSAWTTSSGTFYLALNQGGAAAGPFAFKTGEPVRVAGTEFVLQRVGEGPDDRKFILVSQRTKRAYGRTSPFSCAEGAPIRIGRASFTLTFKVP